MDILIKDKLKADFQNVKNIYDLLVEIYDAINYEGYPGIIQEYDRNTNDPENEMIWQRINNMLDGLLNCDISFSKFIKEFIGLEEQNLEIYCVHILLCFDQIFKEKEEYQYLGYSKKAGLEYLSPLGPMNSDTSEYSLYFMPCASLLDESLAMKNNNCRFINRKNGSDIFYWITSYKIIRNNRLHQIHIKELKRNIFEFDSNAEKNIRIGIVPVSCEKWFDEKYTDHKKGINYFEILNKEILNEETLNKETGIIKSNDHYIKILDSAIQAEVDMVIFPELSMNKETEQVIKSYLIRQTLIDHSHSLKLVFMGSLWENGTNQCVLLSGEGSVLVRNRKKNPFILKKEHKKYVEKLESRPKQYELLDIRHIGRILYGICKDDLSDLEQVSFWNEYEVSLEVISSYTNSLSHFKEQLGAFAKRYKGLGILCNSCAPRVFPGEEDAAVGFLVSPGKEKKPNGDTKEAFDEYYIKKECKNSCGFCKCIHIFDLKPDMREETDTLWKVKIDYSRLNEEE